MYKVKFIYLNVKEVQVVHKYCKSVNPKHPAHTLKLYIKTSCKDFHMVVMSKLYSHRLRVAEGDDTV